MYNINETPPKLCINCMNCRIKNGIVFCSMLLFSDLKENEIKDFVADDFNCGDWEGDE